MGKMTQKPIRLVRNRPKSRGRVDRISRLNRVGLSPYQEHVEPPADVGPLAGAGGGEQEGDPKCSGAS